jgi:peptide-methionine (S)-S-oxide reductase
VAMLRSEKTALWASFLAGVLLAVVVFEGHIALKRLDPTSRTSLGDQTTQPAAAALATAAPTQVAKATFGNGCFWCSEAVFQQVRGVKSVKSGYAGGYVHNPSYEAVCTGTTGHAEVIQLEYDPQQVSYKKLLKVFWKSHDPTTLNRQGDDVGTQYRSVIFFHDEQQQALAEKYKQNLDASGAFRRPIVTQIVPFTKWYPAEDGHQDYYHRNGNNRYCRLTIARKVDKIRQAFAGDLK